MERIFRNARPSTLLIKKDSMMSIGPQSNILTLRATIKPESKSSFIDWQAKINNDIAGFPGFISLEILSPIGSGQEYWVIVQRFVDTESANNWKTSSAHQKLIDELKDYLTSIPLAEIPSSETTIHNAITEVFVTRVAPEKETAFRAWLAKIHQIEAKFPGFRGVYVQSPIKGQSDNWITFLQFDSPENLDVWLNSSERQKVLDESKSLIATIERHRIISPYAGWFATMAKETGKIPPAWKQTMLVLLVLFPIIMFEFKFLNPHLRDLNISLATFIGNAISVTLITFPGMPIAIYFLKWWLSPNSEKRIQINILGTLLLLAIYASLVLLFWNFI